MGRSKGALDPDVAEEAEGKTGGGGGEVAGEPAAGVALPAEPPGNAAP